MNKTLFTILFILTNLAVIAQHQRTIIKGEIEAKAIIADTIYFRTGQINPKYYETIPAPAPLINNHFQLADTNKEPAMYRIGFASEKGRRVWLLGTYFLDPSTTFIKSNFTSDNCSEVNGATAIEYQQQFIPFMIKGYDCKTNGIYYLLQDQGKRVDTLLLNYVKIYPNSWVALWELIGRSELHGHSLIREQTLMGFSVTMKTCRLWKVLKDDFDHCRLKENEKFPDIKLKALDLSATKLVLPQGKYTLIDFWFARCKPCLDTIPVLKKLYNDYKQFGFNIVSISVDETPNIPIWRKRVKEHGLEWAQYLEENNFKANELGIQLFPTFILLDNTGKIISKDFDLRDLDTFLKQNLLKRS